MTSCPPRQWALLETGGSSDMLIEEDKANICNGKIKTHEVGTPIMRLLMFDFSEDSNCWNIDSETCFMFGDDILVAPIRHENKRKREAYLQVYLAY